MTRDVLKDETFEVRFNRNECYLSNFKKRILDGVTINAKDLMLYKSSYTVTTLLEDHFKRCVYVDAGSETVLKNIVLSLEVSKWVIPTPTFELFTFFTQNKNLTIDVYKYKNNKFVFDIQSVIDEAKPDRGVYIVSPHNPTGVSLNSEDIAILCRKFKYVVIDQAYVNPLSNAVDGYGNLIVVRTFSKMGCFAGGRFGFAIGYLSVIDRINQQRTGYLNSLSLKIAERMITQPSVFNDIESDINKYANTAISDFICEKLVCKAGNFITYLPGTPFDILGKKYTIDNTDFFRITVSDIL